MPGEGLARRLGAWHALLFCIAVGCARPARAPDPGPRADPCLVTAPPTVAAESLSIALSIPSALDVGAPAQVDDVRLVRELMYESLIGIDCTGALVPELAERWAADSSGRRWTFTIREDARWPDGEPVTSRDVIAAWRSSSGRRTTATRMLDSAQAIDLRRIRVTLPENDARILAAPELMVVLREPDNDREHGTGAYDAGGIPRRHRMPIERMSALPTLRFVGVASAVDPRDVLDRGIDVMFTEDPAVARYAAAREDLAVIPLPPQRTYSIVTQGKLSWDDSLNRALDALRASLARDVVQVPARPASGPWWWSDAGDCELPNAASSTGSAPLRRVAYREDDPVARAIAERLVSLASRADDVVAKGLLGPADAAVSSLDPAEAMSPSDFAHALRNRTRSAFIVSAPARPLGRCGAIGDFATAMPWTADGGVFDGRFVVPLLDAGAWVIVRRGVVGIAVDWEGTPRLVFSGAGGQDGAP